MGTATATGITAEQRGLCNHGTPQRPAPLWDRHGRARAPDRSKCISSPPAQARPPTCRGERPTSNQALPRRLIPSRAARTQSEPSSGGAAKKSERRWDAQRATHNPNDRTLGLFGKWTLRTPATVADPTHPICKGLSKRVARTRSILSVYEGKKSTLGEKEGKGLVVHAETRHRLLDVSFPRTGTFPLSCWPSVI